MKKKAALDFLYTKLILRKILYRTLRCNSHMYKTVYKLCNITLRVAGDVQEIKN